MGVRSTPEGYEEPSGGGAVLDKGGAGFDAPLLLDFASAPGPFLPTLGLQCEHQCD